jgi:hypothetical protein
VDTKTRLIIALCVIIAGGVIYFAIYRASESDKLQSAQNELARLIPLQTINDSLHFKIARTSEDLTQEIAKNSQLRKLVKSKNEEILFLAGLAMESKMKDTVRVGFDRREGMTVFFDTTDTWIEIKGFVDTSALYFSDIRFRDSITVVVTKTVNDFLYGYVQNHSPYTRINNADFGIDLSLYVDRTSDWWKYGAVAAGAYIVVDAVLHMLTRR